MYEKAKYLTAGDKGIVIEFGNEIAPETSEKVRGMMLALENSGLCGIVAYTPTYRSVMVQYDPLVLSYNSLMGRLKEWEDNLSHIELPPPRIFEVPTLYGGDFGPDLEFVATHNHLTTEQVVQIHTGQEYLVYMLGFTPGFSYLGGMDEAIATPRLQTPRTKIPGGSVGIAAKQTGIYSIDSPGGWQLIGKTPIKLYDPLRNPPIIHQAGDYIKFVPIDESEFHAIEHAVAENSYHYKLYAKEPGV